MAIPLLVLSIIPIGLLSGDGLAQSAAYAKGTWFWNPNHLLYEPLGAAWQSLLDTSSLQRSRPDRLKLLSILAGALAVGIFRYGIASQVAVDRRSANIGTAAVALSATYLALWMSEETQMVQMPLLMLGLWGSITYTQRPRFPIAFAAGIAFGLATLFYVSNALIAGTVGVALGIWHGRHGSYDRAASAISGVGLGSGLVTFGGFLSAWTLTASPHTSFLEWLTSYGGGTAKDRVSDAYGMAFGWYDILLAIVRAVYGATNVLVRTTPIVEAGRDHHFTTQAVVGTLALLVASACLAYLLRRAWYHRKERHYEIVWLLGTAWAAAIMTFAIYWNNSDDQFYFQLAPVVGLLVAAFPWQQASPWLIGATGSIGLWNGIDASLTYVLYPRAAYVSALARATQGAGIILYPGEDEIDRLLYFVPASKGEKISIAGIARTHAPATGFDQLHNRISDAVARGERVDVISIFDVPESQNPWKSLAQIGYPQAKVRAVLQRFSVGPIRSKVGPIIIRSIRTSAEHSRSSGR